MDASQPLALTLARHLEIADRLANNRWQLKREKEGSMAGRLSGGPIHIALDHEEQTDGATTLYYRLSGKRYGITITAGAELECQPTEDGGSIIAIRLCFDSSGLLRFMPRYTIDRRLFHMRQELLLTLDQALEAISSNRENAIAILEEADKQLLLACLTMN